MTKKTKKDGPAAAGKTAKVRTGKLPKRVAGIKVPKELRRSGEKLLEVANSPVGRQVLAAGMTALVAAAAARNKPVREAAADVAGATADSAKGAADAGMTHAGDIVDALASAAAAALQRAFGNKA